MKVYMITGCFAPVHDGHCYLFNIAVNDSKLDDCLIVVGVNDDQYLANKTNWDVARQYPIAERLKEVRRKFNYTKALKSVIPISDTYALARALKPDVIVVGDDYTEDRVVGHEFAKKVLIVPRLPISSTEVRGGLE